MPMGGLRTTTDLTCISSSTRSVFTDPRTHTLDLLKPGASENRFEAAIGFRYLGSEQNALNVITPEPILTYAAETGGMTEKEKETLAIFEGRGLRSIFGGLNCDTIWRKRANLEIYKLLKQTDIVKFTAIEGLQWTGYMIR
ncbi:hypothetical protein TNCV_645651 [Trichonephila clavipes]|nr:hypothetical protein TNCV_645651 [Trichonephila clavipes]